MRNSIITLNGISPQGNCEVNHYSLLERAHDENQTRLDVLAATADQLGELA